MEFKYLSKKCPWRSRVLLPGRGRVFVCCASNKDCSTDNCPPWLFAIRSQQIVDDTFVEMIERINKKQDKD